MKKTVCLFGMLCLVFMMFSCKPEADVVYPEDTYEGFARISMADYKDYLENTATLVIMRKGPLSASWEMCYCAYATVTGKTLKDMHDFVDFYTDAGKTYQYKLIFEAADGSEIACIDNISFKAKRGLGEITLDSGDATYTGSTLSFSKRPSVNYRKLPFPYEPHITLLWQLPPANLSFVVDVTGKGSVDIDQYFLDNCDPAFFAGMDDSDYYFSQYGFHYTIENEGIHYEYERLINVDNSYTRIPGIHTPAFL